MSPVTREHIQADRDQAQREFERALAQATNSTARGPEASGKAAEALRQAQARVAELDAILEAIGKKSQARDDAQAIKAWSRMAELAPAFKLLASEIERDTGSLTAKLGRLQRLGLDLHGLLPDPQKRLTPETPIGPAALARAFNLYLAKLGVRGGLGSPDQLPSFTQSASKAVEGLLAKRPDPQEGIADAAGPS